LFNTSKVCLKISLCPICLIPLRVTPDSAATSGRTIFNIPLCEPISVTAEAIKKMSDVKKILLLATNYTVKVGAYQNKLKEFDVIGQPAQELVKLAEENRHDLKVIDDIMLEYQNKVDTVILGCTHFGYFTEEIMDCVKPNKIVESSYELALFVVEYLKTHDMLNIKGKNDVYFIK
jgi:glutamate racemase